MLSIHGKTGIDYKVQLRDRITGGAVGGLIPLVDSLVPGFYTAQPTAASGRYWAHYYRYAGTASERYLGAEKYDWDGSKEVTPLVADALIKATAKTTELSPLAKTTELAPLATGTALAAVQTSVNAIPAVNLTPLSTAISNVQTVVNATAKTAELAPLISAVDNVQASINAISTVDLAPLTSAVAAVLVQATQTRKAVANNVSVDLVTGIITIWEDNGTTPFLRFQGFNAAGLPSAIAAIRRVKI